MTAIQPPACTPRRAKIATGFGVFVMLVVALLLVRAVTSPRALVSISASPAAITAPSDPSDTPEAIDAVIVAPGEATTAEARPIRRTRTIADPLMALAVLVVMAVAAASPVSRRIRREVHLSLSTLAVAPSSGRGPPVLSI